MKKLISIIIAAFIVVSTFSILSTANEGKQIEGSFFRLHIRADSNEKTAQAIKLKVRDAVLLDMDELLKNAGSKEDTEEVVKNNLPRISACADKVLTAEGVKYKSKVSVGETFFPTRDYGDFRLPAGRYESLIIELGSGAGNNWWCVLYPSLCKGTLKESDTVLTDGGFKLISGGKKVLIRFKTVELLNKIREFFR